MPSLFSRLPLPVRLSSQHVIIPLDFAPRAASSSGAHRATLPATTTEAFARRSRAGLRRSRGELRRSPSCLPVSPPVPPPVPLPASPPVGRNASSASSAFVVHTLYIRSLGIALFLRRRGGHRPLVDDYYFLATVPLLPPLFPAPAARPPVPHHLHPRSRPRPPRVSRRDERNASCQERGKTTNAPRTQSPALRRSHSLFSPSSQICLDTSTGHRHSGASPGIFRPALRRSFSVLSCVALNAPIPVLAHRRAFLALAPPQRHRLLLTDNGV